MSPQRRGLCGTYRSPTELWFLLLVAGTAGLLVLQVALGVVAHSLALLADCGHSSVDVITYGANYYVERLKVQPAEPRSCSIDRLDSLGAFFSATTLIVATIYAVLEVIQRLHSGTVQNDGHFDRLGSALFCFAATSTVTNVAFMIVYYQWFKNARMVAESAAPQPQRVHVTLPQGTPPASVPELPEPLVPPPPRRSQRGKSNRNKVIFCSTFSSSGEQCNGTNCGPACASPVCVSPTTSTTTNDTTGGLASLLHMAVHPGCAGCHHDAGGSAEPATTAEQNLNLGGAMLHIVTDAFRGITFFVVAVLIECGVIQDPGRADAFAALVVSVLILLGAFALLRRVAKTLCYNTSRGHIEPARVERTNEPGAPKTKLGPLPFDV